eukprot:TRINITY_DN1671_c0_g1_i1.p1 TRINITY_DN1671_c0_g1~~TRINITY_DN1671_c0_g1_i1.p1  ORF type:complete len:313 (-),score=55.32 TRINITY_DN1671_c0_g1_i1:96-998(-)
MTTHGHHYIMTSVEFNIIWQAVHRKYYADRKQIPEQIFLTQSEDDDIYFSCDKSLSGDMSSFISVSSAGIKTRESLRSYFYGADMTERCGMLGWGELLDGQLLSVKNDKLYLGDRYVIATFPVTKFMFRFVLVARSFLCQSVPFASCNSVSFLPEEVVNEAARECLAQVEQELQSTGVRGRKTSFVSSLANKYCKKKTKKMKISITALEDHLAVCDTKSKLVCRVKWRDLLLSNSLEKRNGKIYLDQILLCNYSKEQFRYLMKAHNLIHSRLLVAPHKLFFDEDETTPPPTYQDVIQRLM